jgi:hypothetical protein
MIELFSCPGDGQKIRVDFVPCHLSKLVNCCQSVANSLETMEGMDEIDSFYPYN